MYRVPELRPRRPRNGGALLVALALLALGAALLAGSSALARSAARAETSHEAALLAVAESRVVLAEFMAVWGAGEDALAVGQGRVTTVGPRRRGFGSTVVQTRLRLLRLTQLRFVLAADCQVGPDDAVLARRRVYLVVERALQAGSTLPTLAPAPISRWALTDIY
jgi:type II secretory pathway component PulK